MMILIVSIAIIVFACLHVKDDGWGDNVSIFNNDTWLTMIGSAIFSYEGIGVVIPILEVTNSPQLFPRILTMVLMTVMFLYSGFGIFNLFAYGDFIKDKPLITQALE